MSKAGVTKNRRVFLAGMLVWWNEPADLLYQCVESCAGFLDRIVALDGGYRLTPGAGVRSPEDERDAIKDAARAAGLDVKVLTPDGVWNGQVEKRNWLIRYAANISEFVMPVDADWLLRGDPDKLRAELAAHPNRDTFTVRLETPIPDAPDFDMAKAASDKWHAETAGRVQNIELIYRSLPGIRVEAHHWWVSAIRGGQRVALWGCPGVYPTAHKHRIEAPFWIDHMCLFRDAEWVQRNRVFCARRDLEVAQTGVES